VKDVVIIVVYIIAEIAAAVRSSKLVAKVTRSVPKWRTQWSCGCLWYAADCGGGRHAKWAPWRLASNCDGTHTDVYD